MAKLLLIEDDASLSFMIQTCLESDRHFVDAVENGQQALAMLKTRQYDLMVLDWNLPDISGLEVCSRHRSAGGTTPIIMLTAKGASQDKVQALDSGIDDYLSKPFDPQELLARVRALLRRPKAIASEILAVGPIQLNSDTLEVKLDGAVIELSVKECAVLQLLMKHPNKGFSAESIMQRLWPSDSDSSPDTVRTHIKNLRKKLKDSDGSLIKLTRGLGYSFAARA